MERKVRDATEAGNSAGAGGSRRSSYEAHLERSRRVWDRWSDYYAMSERDLEPMREAAIDRLALESGDRVLDVGCGPGVNFERLRDAIGPEGQLVAVDYSPEMVAKAWDRVEQRGWENVEVRRADATTVEFEEPFDAAVATLSLSVMPDVRGAAENAYGLLAPGGSFAVCDVRPVPAGPLRLANPLLRRFFRWYANRNPDGDVLESLRAVFDECAVLETYWCGIGYAAVCRRAGSSDA